MTSSKPLFRLSLLTVLSFAAMSAPAARAAGLILYFPFEAAGSPTSYTDVAGGNIATISSTANVGTSGTVPAGIGSTRSIYDNGNGYLTLGTFADAVHKEMGGGLTIAFWINAASQTGRTMFGEGSTTENNSFFSLGTGSTDGTKFRFLFRGSNGSVIADKTSVTSINTGTWHHVVWTDDGGGNAKLYVDGVRDATDFTYTSPVDSLLANFDTSTIAGLVRLSGSVGTWGAGGGRMDDFAIWDTALPESSITALFNGTKTPLTVPTTTDFGTWSNGFGPGFTDKASGSDPDGDGLTNQQEYAFGLDPTLGSSVNPIAVPFDKQAGTFTYTRRDQNLTGLLYTVETSTDLLTWTPDPGSMQDEIDIVNDIITVQVTLSSNLLSAPKLLVRISAR